MFAGLGQKTYIYLKYFCPNNKSQLVAMQEHTLRIERVLLCNQLAECYFINYLSLPTLSLIPPEHIIAYELLSLMECFSPTPLPPVNAHYERV